MSGPPWKAWNHLMGGRAGDEESGTAGNGTASNGNMSNSGINNSTLKNGGLSTRKSSKRNAGGDPTGQGTDAQAMAAVQAGKTTQPMPALHSMRSLTSEAIENQLMLMWRQAARADLASGNPVVAHNSVMTLIAFTGDKYRSGRIEQVTSAIIAQVAARAIVLIPVPHQPPTPPLDVSVSIQEHDAEGNPAHGEAITIKARDDSVPHLPGAVLPLVLSGLPAFLWWSGEPPWHTELFDALVDGCDRLIVDTSEAENAPRALFRLNELVSRKKGSLGVTDLNWFRQEPWRELVAQFFDDVSTRSYLYGIERLNIEYAAGASDTASDAAQAYLFAGWFASRLGWVPYGLAQQTSGELTRELPVVSPQGKRITIALAPRFGVPIAPWIDITALSGETQGSDGADGNDNGNRGDDSRRGADAGLHLNAVGPGALMSVRLEAVADGKPGSFSVTREDDLETATTDCEADCAMPTQSCHLPTLGEAQSLLEQLRILGHDTLYEHALSMAAHLAAPDGRRPDARRPDGQRPDGRRSGA